MGKEAKEKAAQRQEGKAQGAELTCLVGKAGFVELAHVKLQPDDGKHHDGEEEEQPNLQQGHHGLHDGLEDNLQACGDTKTPQGGKANGALGVEGRWERGAVQLRIGNTKQCCFSQGAIKQFPAMRAGETAGNSPFVVSFLQVTDPEALTGFFLKLLES